MSERKIVDYIFVVFDYAEGFSEQVQSKIKEGYQPYFGPVMASVEPNGWCNGQAMVKYED